MSDDIRLVAWRDKKGGLLLVGGEKYEHVRLYFNRDAAFADLKEKLIIPPDIEPVLTEFDLSLEDCHHSGEVEDSES